MDSNNHETKLSNEPKHEGEEPLLSGEGDKETLEGQKPETEAKNEEQAAGAAEADDDDNYDYEGMSKKEICMIEKNKGNERFKEANYMKASKHFTKALMAFKYATEELAEGGLEELEKAVKEIQIPCHLNLALCFLKMEEYDMVKVHSKHVLEIDPDNVKALYRKALAEYHTGYLSDAKDDLKLAYELDPSNQEVVKLMHMVKEKRKAEHEKEKKINQKIISNLGFEETPSSTTATQIESSQQKEAPKEEKHLKSKKVEDKGELPELNRMEKKMSRVVADILKQGISAPLNWVKNKCCSRRKSAKEEKKD